MCHGSSDSQRGAAGPAVINTKLLLESLQDFYAPLFAITSEKRAGGVEQKTFTQQKAHEDIFVVQAAAVVVV